MRRSLRLMSATAFALSAVCFLAQFSQPANAFSSVQSRRSRHMRRAQASGAPQAGVTGVYADADASSQTPSTPLFASSVAAALHGEEKPPRRKFFRSVRRAVVGVVTASSFRQQSSARQSIAPPTQGDPIAAIETNGNVVELKVGNLDGAVGGTIRIQLYPELAPVGAKRFEELVAQAFFDDARVFRVVPGVLAQFGIHGDPEVQAKWRSASIPDDPVRMSNKRGTLVFCKAASSPNSTGRTSQVVINTHDNTFLDNEGFSPFGRVIEGLDLVDRFFSGYHENEPNPGMIQAKGDNYLRPNFPKLSYISKANIIQKESNDNGRETSA